MLLPKQIHEDIATYNKESLELLKDNPWLVPATLAITTAPMVICAYGFWKNRQLSKKLKIEREKTKQLALNQATPHGLQSIE